MIRRNRLLDAQFEIRELERLLLEARLRERKIAKEVGHQGWVDWIFEFLGF